MKTISTALFVFLTAATGACDADDPSAGELEVVVYGEEFAEMGISSGDVIDGWSIEFDSFFVDLGEIRAAKSGFEPAFVVDEYQRFDVAVPSDGDGQFVARAAVPAGTYDDVSFRLASVEVSGRAVAGSVTKTFSWRFDRPTTYGGCEGTAVVAPGADGSVARTELTIHADHLFFDDLVSDEPNIAFDLIASADDAGDADGAITQTELAALDIRPLERYQVGNRTELTDLWSFIEAQAGLVGHIDGEGHCQTAARE